MLERVLEWTNRFPRLILNQIMDTIQDVYIGKITKIAAAKMLLDLTDKQNGVVTRIILCIKSLILELPSDTIMAGIKESNC
jgi:hypothetical protein